MGGKENNKAPINEAIFLINELSSGKLDEFRTLYPEIREELNLGIKAGGTEENDSYIIEKSKIMISALEIASENSVNGIEWATKKVHRSRLLKLTSEIVLLLSSSSILGALAMEEKELAIISALITFFASGANIISSHFEKLTNPAIGNIYDAFQKLVDLNQQMLSMKSEIELSVKYEKDQSLIIDLIKKGNSLIAEANKWFPQIAQLYF